MVRQPGAFLFDEPLSNLDPALRAQARAEIARMHRTLATTVVCVTHDQEEAMTLGWRVAVMRQGALEQIAPPLEVCAQPANTFVARFIGAPPMNLVPAQILGIDAPDGTLAGVRPHDIEIGAAGGVPAVVELVEPRGHDAVVHLRLDASATPTVLAVVERAPCRRQPRKSRSRTTVYLFDETSGRRLPQ
jgi:ABC-type sugar transport system ATPase subunit